MTPPDLKASVLVPLEELVKMESAVAGLQEQHSFAMWLISTIFAQVSGMELEPEESGLLKILSNSLCAAMAQQASTSHGLAAFLVNLRRTHFSKFLHPAVMEGQRTRLMSSPLFSSDLFDQEVLGQVREEFAGDAVTSSNLSFTSWFAKSFLRKHAESSSVSGLATFVVQPASPVVPPTAWTSSAAAPPAKPVARYKGKGGRKGRYFKKKGPAASTSKNKQPDLPK